MTAEEMHINFKLGVDKSDTMATPDFEPEEVDSWLNVAQERIVKQRYSGHNFARNSLEETQKRTDDLRELIMSESISPDLTHTGGKPYSVFYTLPNDSLSNNIYWFAINEEVEIVYKDCNSKIVVSGNLQPLTYYIVNGTITYTTEEGSQLVTDAYFKTDDSHSTFTGNGIVYSATSKRTNVKPIHHDDYNLLIKDPFNKSYKGSILRLMYQDKSELVGTQNVIPGTYYLRYIKKPRNIYYDVIIPSNSINSELADHMHQEIVELAVSIALENIESRRYQTNLNELSTQE